MAQNLIEFLKAAEDWEILAYYTPKVFDWLGGKVELSEADKAVCHELRQKLETQCQWTDKNNQMHTGVPTSNYEAIRIMNKKTDKTIIISWKNNEVIAGTWIDFGAYSEYISSSSHRFINGRLYPDSAEYHCFVH